MKAPAAAYRLRWAKKQKKVRQSFLWAIPSPLLMARSLTCACIARQPRISAFSETDGSSRRGLPPPSPIKPGTPASTESKSGSSVGVNREVGSSAIPSMCGQTRKTPPTRKAELPTHTCRRLILPGARGKKGSASQPVVMLDGQFSSSALNRVRTVSSACCG